MKNEQTVPVAIMDLSGRKHFAALTPAEQTMVMQFISESEYNELYKAHQNIAGYFDEDKNLAPSFRLKQKLDLAVQQKRQKTKPVLLQPVPLWKVAAAFLVLFSASCFYLKKSAESKYNTGEMLVHDTVFVDKNIEVIRHIIDTVVEYRYGASFKEKIQKRTKLLPANAGEQQDTARIWKRSHTDIGIRTLQPEDLLKELPNNNGKSIQEDELIKRFSFARI